MPRSTHSRRASNRKSTTPEIEDVTVSSATATNGTETETEAEDTVRELPFEVSISDAPDGYRPDRSPAGRKRIPSPFEDVLPDLKGKGWKNQPHDGKVILADQNSGKVVLPDGVKESNARIILRELSKAVKFLNSEDGGEHNLGLDVNVTPTDVQFNIRSKQNRKPRSAPGGGDVSDGEQDDSDDGDESDSIGDE